MREIKFQYIFEDIDILTGNKRIHKRDFFLEDIEEDNAFFSMCDIIARRQYTGLKDKNGKEIYEGDIVKHKQVDGGLLPRSEEKICFIDFCFNQWCCRRNKEHIGYTFIGGNMEIIGNIYENPNLLKNE